MIIFFCVCFIGAYAGKSGWFQEHIHKEVERGVARECRHAMTVAGNEPRWKKVWRYKWIIRGFVGSVIFFSLGWWETSRWEKIQFLQEQREKFRGDTAFYGKCWGYQTDYMIELGLQTGDIFFVEKDGYGLHVWQGLWKKFQNAMFGNVFDEMGVILKRRGLTYVVFPTSTGLRAEKYCDLLAHYRISSVFGRRLYCSDEDRENLRKAMEEDFERGCKTSNRFLQFFQYVKCIRKPDFSRWYDGGNSMSELPVPTEFAEALQRSHQRCDIAQAIEKLKELNASIEIDGSERMRNQRDITKLSEALMEIPEETVAVPSLADTLSVRDDGDYFAKLFGRVGLMPPHVMLHHIRIDQWEKMNRLSGRLGEPEIGTELSPAFFVRETDHSMYVERKWSKCKIPKKRLVNPDAEQSQHVGAPC